MTASHRDPEGRKKVDRDHPSLVERLIAEAIERGEFDDLPGRGKPLPRPDENEVYAGEWRMAFGILKNAGVAPPWIEADKEVRRLREARDSLLEQARRAGALMRRRYRDQLAELVEAHDRAVEQVNTQAPSERQHRRRMQLHEEIERLEVAFGRKSAS